MTRDANPIVTKRQFAYNELRSLILGGKLEPGTRLRLRPLAAQLGVSVMPIRDALRDLEADGLVFTQDHQGTYVLDIPQEELLESVGLRMWLETYAVVRAAEIRDEASLALASRQLENGRRALEKGSGSEFSRANRRFHEAIEAPVPGPARDMIEDLWNRVWQIRRTGSLFVLAPERMESAHAEHQEILDAVKRGDVAAAFEVAERHREVSLQAWTKALKAVALG
jgi:DNA-binding GntR family transcriptional regulator